MAADPLTTQEVERYARLMLGRLYAIAWPATVPDDLAVVVANVRRNVDQACEFANELLLLCDMVDVVDSGIAVMVDPESKPPA